MNSCLRVKLLCNANILLILLKEGLKIDLAIALIASYTLIIVYHLLGLMTGSSGSIRLEPAINLVSRWDQLMGA